MPAATGRHRYPPSRRPKKTAAEKVADAIAAPGDADDEAGRLLAGLPGEQQRAVLALLAGKSIRAAARGAGIPERTLYRWYATDGPFKAAYRAAQRKMFDRTFDQLSRVATEAVQVIRKRVAGGDLKAALAAIRITTGQPEVEEPKPITMGDLRRQLDEVREQAERRGLLRPTTPPVVSPPAPPTPPGTPAATP